MYLLRKKIFGTLFLSSLLSQQNKETGFLYYISPTADFSIKQVSILTRVSIPTICIRLVTSHYFTADKLPEAVSIDEFKGNASTGNYQCILVTPEKHRILDILPERTQKHLAYYRRNITRKESLKVKFFICDSGFPM